MRSAMLGSLLIVAVMLSSPVYAADEYKVVQLTEYCRHGARTTWYTPNLNLDLTQKYGIGTLTPNGMRMNYLLGAQLRKNYKDLFGTIDQNKLTFNDVEVYASAVARSQLSAVSQMTGLFPFGLGSEITTPGQEKYYNPPLADLSVKVEGNDALPKRFYPVPLIINDKNKDVFFFGSYVGTCPLADAYSKEWDSAQYKKFDYLVQDLARELEEKGFSAKKMYGLDKWDIKQLALLSDEIITYENYHGKKYMDMSEDLFKKVFHAHNVKFTSEFNNSKICRMRADGVARSIIEGMDRVVNGKPGQKTFRLFSGHDTGTYSHILLLGLTNLECLIDKLQEKPVKGRCEYIPEFSSQFLYELAVKEDKYFVRALYNGKPFEVCEGKTYCPYEEFKTAFSAKLFMKPDEFLEFCGNQYLKAVAGQTPKTVYKPFTLWYIILVGSLLALILTGLIIWKYKKATKQISYGMPHESQSDHTITVRQNMTESLNPNSPA